MKQQIRFNNIMKVARDVAELNVMALNDIIRLLGKKHQFNLMTQVLERDDHKIGWPEPDKYFFDSNKIFSNDGKCISNIKKRLDVKNK